MMWNCAATAAAAAADDDDDDDGMVMMMQSVPQISSLTWVTTLIPLVSVLLVTGIKDIIDDIVSQAFSSPKAPRSIWSCSLPTDSAPSHCTEANSLWYAHHYF